MVSATAQRPLFTLLDNQETGLNFVNEVPSFEQMNVLISQYHYNGAGVSIGDLNNDGLPEIFVNANFGPDKLFLNKGNLQFEDISKKAGIEGTMSWETGVNMVDINNDGFLDLFVCRSGHAPGSGYSNLLYINNGDLTFSESIISYALFDISHSTQSYFLDYDRDGDLDLYLLNHNPKRTENYDFTIAEAGRNEQVGDILFRNDHGQFTDVSAQAGIIGKSISYGLGAIIADFNNDLWPDIYVCNDFGERDYFYVNSGDGTFIEQLIQSFDHISWYSMGGDAADINDDGLLDLMVLDMTAADHFRQKTNMNDMNPAKFNYAVKNGLHYQYMINTLQLNLGHGTFSEIAMQSGVAYSDWSWSPLFADFDQDGSKDLFITNGYRVDISNKDYSKWLKERQAELSKIPVAQRNVAEELQEALTRLNKQQIPNYMFQNQGNLSFKDVTESWGLDKPSFSNGVAYGDLDLDGDLDLVINNIDHSLFLYKNNAVENQPENAFLKIRLVGPPKNIFGIGSKIILTTEEGMQHQEFYLARGYLSSVEPIIHFGLGTSQPLKVEVVWYDESRTTLSNPTPNQLHEVNYSERDDVFYALPLVKPILQDITDQIGINYLHQENVFDDFQTEVLLPHKQSQFGPALAVGDVNQDGLEDFFVGGAKDQPSAMYVQNQSGLFKQTNQVLWSKEKIFEDLDAAFFDADGDADLDLYVVSGGYDFEGQSPLLRDRLYINDGNGDLSPCTTGILPDLAFSGGCVCPGDYDGDGDIDLFVGGRVVPGRYPEAPRSVLLQNHQGFFSDVTQTLAPALEHPGLVTDATWTDINGDQKLDLIVTGEWMYPLILVNQEGKLQELHTTRKDRGWWYSVTASDVDSDGDQDLLLGNLGLNYKYKATLQKPFEIYVNDFDESGSLDIVLGYYEENKLFPVRGKQCSSQQMPFIADKYKTYNEFAQATIVDIYGQSSLDKSLHYKATMFESVLAINDGKGNYIWTQLPALAQTAPINDVIALDYNHDGHQDFFVAGNLFQSEVETPRADAGKGWLMQGDGRGSLAIIPPTKAGIIADGDVKKLARLKLATGEHMILVARNNGRLGAYLVSTKTH